MESGGLNLGAHLVVLCVMNDECFLSMTDLIAMVLANHIEKQVEEPHSKK